MEEEKKENNEPETKVTFPKGLLIFIIVLLVVIVGLVVALLILNK